MDALDHRIHLQQLQLPSPMHPNHGTIIPRARDYRGRGFRKGLQKPADDGVLPHHS
jgi:hypothetical protein